MEFGDVVRNLMESRGMSQRDLAVASSMSEAKVSQICSGKTKDPRMSTLIALCVGLNCSMDELVPNSKQ